MRESVTLVSEYRVMENSTNKIITSDAVKFKNKVLRGGSLDYNTCMLW